MTLSTQPLADLYRACGTIGNEGTPGAPVVHYSLLADPKRNTVTGTVQITQAIQGANSDITVDVTGTIKEYDLPIVANVVTISGKYTHACPPPQECIEQREFSANMFLDGSWNGQGGFTYGNDQINKVPVKSTPC